jgi:hypothetical protein
MLMKKLIALLPSMWLELMLALFTGCIIGAILMAVAIAMARK